jgi:hypothetical protein
VVSYKIGTVNAYYARLSMMAVDLTADLYLNDEVLVNGRAIKIKKIKVDYENVDCGRKGETVVVNVDFPVADGDELMRS